jgi:hypothetical protein
MAQEKKYFQVSSRGKVTPKSDPCIEVWVRLWASNPSGRKYLKASVRKAELSKYK